jgi:hypothetical protein
MGEIRSYAAVDAKTEKYRQIAGHGSLRRAPEKMLNDVLWRGFAGTVPPCWTLALGTAIVGHVHGLKLSLYGGR